MYHIISKLRKSGHAEAPGPEQLDLAADIRNLPRGWLDLGNVVMVSFVQKKSSTIPENEAFAIYFGMQNEKDINTTKKKKKKKKTPKF